MMTNLDVTSAIFGGVIGGLLAGITTYIGFNTRLIEQGIKLKQIEEQTKRLLGDFTLQKLVDVHLEIQEQSNSLQSKINTIEEDIGVYGDQVHKLKVSENYNRIKDI